MSRYDYAVHVLRSLTANAMEDVDRQVQEEAERPGSGLEHRSIESLIDRLRAEEHVTPANETEDVSWRGLLNTSKGD